jgi:2'-5' RNA ligase
MNHFFKIIFFCFLGSASLLAKPATLSNIQTPKSPLFTFKGDVFTAVSLPKNIQAKVLSLQKQISKCLGATKFSPAYLSNLHITLQVLYPVHTAAELNKIHKALEQAANQVNQWSMAKHLAHVRLSISADGIVKLQLPRSDTLTHLAQEIRGTLKKHGITYNSRFDYPDHAHITIGVVNPKQRKELEAELHQCMKAKKLNVGDTMRSSNFPVHNFVLLKSNNPEKKRCYAQLAQYAL